MQWRILEALEPFQHHRWLAATLPTCTSSSPQRSMIWSVSAPTCASKTPPASEIAALVCSRSAAVWKSGVCTRSPNGINPARRPSALASREGSAPCSSRASSSGVRPCPWWPGMRTTFPASASVSRDRSAHPSHGETPARSGSCSGQNPDKCYAVRTQESSPAVGHPDAARMISVSVMLHVDNNTYSMLTVFWSLLRDRVFGHMLLLFLHRYLLIHLTGGYCWSSPRRRQEHLANVLLCFKYHRNNFCSIK
jgi:hypothetical protein